MTSKRFIAVLELARPVNTAFAFVAVGISVVLFGLPPDRWIEILSAACAGGLIAAGANAINDYFDLEIDAVNRPERPLPRRALTRPQALTVWGVTSACGISLNVFLHWSAFLIAAAAVLVLVGYSAWFKRQVLVGNLVVAFMTGMVFLYAGVVAGDPGKGVIPALFAFLANFSRELVKDVEDLAGDRAQNARTLAVVAGPRIPLMLAAGTLGLLIVVTIVPYVAGMYGETYLGLVGVVDLVLVVVAVLILRGDAQAHLRLASGLLKIGMVIGLGAIVAGV